MFKLTFLAAGLAALGCSPAQTSSVPPVAAPAVTDSSSALRVQAQGQFAVLPAPDRSAPALTALGRRLFFETGASADGKVGCVTCHLPEKWGSDGLALSRGVFGKENARNAPTVLNAAGQLAEHWHGDRQSVEDQATRALRGPASFGNASDEEALARLKQLPGADAAFRAAFPDDPAPIDAAHWGKAIGAYERSLLNPGPFDAWLEGDAAALSPQAQRGLAQFMETGCAECHDGPLVGGSEFAKFGRHAEYWTRTQSAKVDVGRWEATHDESDRYVFKVAPLRNVARTGPYFHDGSVAALTDAVDIMADVQLQVQLSPETRADIVAFLESLTGPVPADFAPPAAPAPK